MNELFKKRESVRSFRDKMVEEEKLEEIIEAANSAPSAGGLRAREIISVTDPDLKKKTSQAAYDQKHVADAPALLVFVALPEKSAEKYADRGRDLYATQDATLAAGFAWLEAIDLGLSASWVGGFIEEEVRKILDLSENQKPIAILTIGYAK